MLGATHLTTHLTALITSFTLTTYHTVGVTPPAKANGGSSVTMQAVINEIISQPVRLALTLVILVVAVVASRWLAGLVERVPVRVETRVSRSGKRAREDVVMGRAGLSEWLGRLTAVCVWVAAVVAIGFTWFTQTDSGTAIAVGNFATIFGRNLGASVIVIAITLGAASVLQRTVAASLTHNRVNRNLTLLGGRIIYVATLVVGFVIILQLWGTGIVVPVALLGALTVALSLALQGVLTNLVSGIYLLLERPFMIGDSITMGAFTGEVEDIQIRYTALRTADGQRVIIPNSMLFNSAVVNLSHYQNRRGGLSVALADSSADAIDAAEDRLHGALRAVEGVLSNPEPQILLSSVTASKVELQVIYWIARGDFSANAAIFSQLIEEVRRRLPDAEVAMLDPAASASAV